MATDWTLGFGSSSQRRRTQREGGGGGSSSRSGMPSRPSRPGSQSDRLPIGVPEGYSIDVPRNLSGMSARGAEGWASQGAGHGTTVARGPRYYDGDEWRPAGMSPNNILALQQDLSLAGFLTEDFSPMVWDDSTLSAYKRLLSFANARGVTWEAALSLAKATVAGGGQFQYDPTTGQFVQSGGASGAQEPVPPAPVYRTTDPAVLKEMFRRAAIETAGVGWGEHQVNAAVEAYNWVEIQRQKELYDAQLAAGMLTPNDQPEAGHVVDIPSPEAWFQAYARKEDPKGVATQGVLDYTNEFMRLAGSTAWGVGQAV